MATPDLARLLRGAQKRAVEDLLALASAELWVEDASGKLLVGRASTAGDLERAAIERAAIECNGEAIGAVVGSSAARASLEKVARLVSHLVQRETEKLGLAAETLGRYKELTLLYEMSSSLSRVLDVEQVAEKIVQEAHRFLRASEAALYLVDRRRESLVPCASIGHAAPISMSATGLEVDALRTLQASLVEEIAPGAGSAIVAPLRAGDAAFGVLRFLGEPGTAWTAGELKLVTSLAESAASAISHAMLHHDQLRQQALRNQIERFVSPTLLEAALEDMGEQARKKPMIVAYFDVSALLRSMDARVGAEEVLAAMLTATATAMDVLLAHGATLSSAHGEMVVALFGESHSAESSAPERAMAAAVALVRQLDRRHGGSLARCPGIGIGRLLDASRADSESFFESVGVAASLQVQSEGRILVEVDVVRDSVAQPTGPGESRADLSRGPSIETARGLVEVYEVRP